MTTKPSIFQKYFCCGASSQIEEPKQIQKNTHTINDYTKEQSKDSKQYNLQFIDGYYYDKTQKIKTKHQMYELRYSDQMNENTPHSCPICFRYFNFILNSSCCLNNICHICAIEYKCPKCHFCQNSNCKLLDADSQKLKIYTDSQGMQLISMQKQK